MTKEKPVKLNNSKVKVCLRCDHTQEEEFHVCPKCNFDIMTYRKNVRGLQMPNINLKHISIGLFLFIDFYVLGPMMVSHRSYELPIAWAIINTLLIVLSYNKINNHINKKEEK